MRLHRVFFGATGLAFLCNFASAQATDKLFRQVQQSEVLARHARIGGTLRLWGAFANGRAVHSIHWAYADGKEHETEHGRAAEEERVWDGTDGLTCTRASGAATWINTLVSRNPIEPSPIRDGYLANAPGESPSRPVSLAEIMTLPGLKVETTPLGRVRLCVTLPELHFDQMIELDPNRGFMIDLTRERVWSIPDSRTGERTLMVGDEREVLQAKNIAGVWIPTKVRDRFPRSSDTKPLANSGGGYELVDVTTKVPDSEFSLPAEVWADARDPLIEYRKSGYKGPGPWTPTAGARGPRVSPGTVKALTVAGAVFLIVSIVLLFRRGRKQSTEHWGPPGGGPQG